MSSFNKVILMGNLTRDPELRFTKSEMAVCKVGLAMNEKYNDKETTTFVDVTIFGKRAEAFEKFHKKGSAAFIEGKLRLDSWEDKNGGGKRSKLYVIADNWEFVSGGDAKKGGAKKKEEEGSSRYEEKGDEYADTDDFFEAMDAPF